jgi:glucose-induced degradation protein 4
MGWRCLIGCPPALTHWLHPDILPITQRACSKKDKRVAPLACTTFLLPLSKAFTMKFAKTMEAGLPHLPRECPRLESPPHWEPDIESTTFAPIMRSLKTHTQAYIDNDFQLPIALRHQAKEQARRLSVPPCLQANTMYTGYQTGTDCSGNRQEYRVSVEIRDVDLEASWGCGLLSIFQLTPAYPLLTTYFDAEIIGSTREHTFNTQGRWSTHSDTDYRHWNQFPHWRHHLASTFSRDPNFSYDWSASPPNITSSASSGECPRGPFIYMRWKERFLVPMNAYRSLEGASYDGFYYICLDVGRGSIDGYYYHTSTSEYQRLCLEVEKRAACGACARR